MSKRNRHHLAPVPAALTTPPLPGPRSYTERLEIPTGGSRDVDGLVRELCRTAFRAGLVGFETALDGRLGVRCFATVRVHQGFTAEQVDAGHLAIKRALVALGVLQVKPAAVLADSAAATEAEAQDPKDGAESQPPPSPPS